MQWMDRLDLDTRHYVPTMAIGVIVHILIFQSCLFLVGRPMSEHNNPDVIDVIDTTDKEQHFSSRCTTDFKACDTLNLFG